MNVNKPEKINALAIDPGGTTGIAMCLEGIDRMLTHTTSTHEELWDRVQSFKWDVVVCERFATSGRLSKYGLKTIELVGGVRGLCYALEIPFEYRQPENRTAFQDVAHDYLAGTKHVIHEVEALAHLLAWLDNIKRSAV